MTLAVVAAGTLLSRSSSCGYIDRTAVVESENYRNSESGYNKSSLNVIFDPINNLLHRSFLSPPITNLAQNLTAQWRNFSSTLRSCIPSPVHHARCGRGARIAATFRPERNPRLQRGRDLFSNRPPTGVAYLFVSDLCALVIAAQSAHRVLR